MVENTKGGEESVKHKFWDLKFDGNAWMHFNKNSHVFYSCLLNLESMVWCGLESHVFYSTILLQSCVLCCQSMGFICCLASFSMLCMFSLRNQSNNIAFVTSLVSIFQSSREHFKICAFDSKYNTIMLFPWEVAWEYIKHGWSRIWIE